MVNIISLTLPFVSQNHFQCHGLEIYSWSWQNHFWAQYIKEGKRKIVHKENLTTTLIIERLLHHKSTEEISEIDKVTKLNFRSIIHFKTHQKLHLAVGIGSLYKHWHFYSAFLSQANHSSIFLCCLPPADVRPSASCLHFFSFWHSGCHCLFLTCLFL